MYRIYLDVDSLKLRSVPPKHDINESLKAMKISIDENLDKDGTGDESTLVKRHPNVSEFLDLDAKFGKSGMEEVLPLEHCVGFPLKRKG